MGDLYAHSVRVAIPGAPGHIELNDGANVRIVEWNPPLPQWQRQTIEGPYQAGRVLVSAVASQVVLNGAVRIYGSNWANQQAWTRAVLAALSQRAFTLTEALNAVTRVWECEPADFVLGEGGMDPWGVNRARQVYTFSIPCLEVTP